MTLENETYRADLQEESKRNNTISTDQEQENLSFRRKENLHIKKKKSGSQSSRDLNEIKRNNDNSTSNDNRESDDYHDDDDDDGEDVNGEDDEEDDGFVGEGELAETGSTR